MVIDPFLAAASTTSSGSSSVSIWIAIIVAATAIVGSLIPQVSVVIRDARQRQRDLDKIKGPEGSLETRLDALSESMRQSARLVEQVSAELQARAVTARRLQEEAANAEALAALHKEQTEAVRRLLRVEVATELEAQERRIFKDSVRIAVISFISGGAVTFLVTLLVAPLH